MTLHNDYNVNLVTRLVDPYFGGYYGFVFAPWVYVQGMTDFHSEGRLAYTFETIGTFCLVINGRFHTKRRTNRLEALRTSRPMIFLSNVNSRRTTHLLLVIINSYLDGQTDDFLRKRPGNNRFGCLQLYIKQNRLGLRNLSTPAATLHDSY